MQTLAITLLLIVTAVSTNAGTYEVTAPSKWWQNTILYEIWVESFKDSNGDGKGDLAGITSKLDHFVDMGVDSIWLTPFYASPMTDSGYDISDYRAVNPTYGTLDDFDALVAQAHKLGIRVVVDFVANHVSDKHDWYVKAKQGIAPYVDYFIWNNGTLLPNGTRVPPNNWVEVFNEGSMWLWVEERKAYVFHQFNTHQIDLNYRNPKVVEEMSDVLTFWMDHGVDGFRFDAVPHLVEAANLTDEPLSNRGYQYPNWFYLRHPYTLSQPEDFEVAKKWKEHINNYTEAAGDGKIRAVFTEAYVNMSFIIQWYGAGIDIPFNFFFITNGEVGFPATLNTASDIVSIIDTWMTQMPTDKTANWVFGNHDMDRVADRFGKKRVDGVNFMLFLLPGVADIYSGDELGVNGTYLTWKETTDVRACSTSPETYTQFSRDPVRTPFPWDNTTSAGFSTNSTPFLKVSPDYQTVNLAAQKKAKISHYKNVQKVIKLRDTAVVKEGNLVVDVLEKNVVAIARTLKKHQPIVVLINWSDTENVTVSVDKLVPNTESYQLLIADTHSGLTVGTKFECSRVTLPPSAAVVLRGVNE